ncbi:hypothetical protein FRX94_04575 [Corynebacterium canis]|uniref:Uncharacterized protein n=1 Tax=Corynebacterium canis TaxID=679663 RepID=A0A5C5UKC1_9CORY|nr:hypothetical protein [Corynebacterium canis]TWT26674.1 hypothetical protein FRX94_04575 [Corynebacterium canis]
MCRATTCPDCKKTTWTGCGRHIDQVMASVPESQRCHHKPTSSAEAAAAQPARRSGGFLGALFGGR